MYFRAHPVDKSSGMRSTRRRACKSRCLSNAPYEPFVTKDARFWNASGVSLSLDAWLQGGDGALVSLLAGGWHLRLPVK